MVQNTKPNVVLLYTDDQRFDTIAALGNTAIQTPNMDRLVSQGTTFTHACIPGGTSGAVCMPSRAMLHTGRSLFHLEGAGQAIPKEHTMLGETFRAAGYRTFGSGKWHNGKESYQRSFTDGDEVFFGGMADHWNVPMHHFDPSGQYDTIRPEILSPMTSNEIVERNCDHIHVGQHSSKIIADAGIDFIEQYDRKNPFFLYLAFLAPHDPRSMPQEYLDMYDQDTIELPPNFLPVHPFDNGELKVRDEVLAGFPRTEKETRRHIAEYYGMITHLDAQIGRVLQALKDQDLLEETIVVLAGDNGLAVGQHGLFGKQSCYEHSIRVPLVFQGPGIPQGVQSTANVYLFDIFPTLCALTGIEVPASVDGTSLKTAMSDPTETVRDSMYFAYTDKQRAVKKENYKLIEYVVNGRHTVTQLFDLSSDPWELQSLADDPDHVDKILELRQELKELCQNWEDTKSEWGTRFWQGCDI